MLRQIIVDTTSPTPGAGKTFFHSLGVVPDLVSITPKAAAVIYMASKLFDRVVLVGDVASAPFEMMVASDHSIIK